MSTLTSDKLPGFKNIGLLGEIIDYTTNEEELKIGVKRSLDKNFIAAIKNVHPATENELIRFAHLIGRPVQKHNRDGKLVSATPEYVNKVGFRADIPEANRLPTQDSDELKLHTARAYSKIKPAYFVMLMVNPGWIEEKPGLNGESLLVKWSDVIAEFKSRYPATGERDLNILMTQRIAYNPWYITETPDDSPLISWSESEGDYIVRCWEDLVNKAAELQFDNKEEYMDILIRFYDTANSCSKMIQYIMEENFMVILDNRRVAHGRHAFVRERLNTAGIREYNPRNILAIGVHKT